MDMMQGSYSVKSDTSENTSTQCSSKLSKLSRQDPASHRLIEKRRRDRMNSCLADLSQLIPSVYLRKGQSRIEKTEIIELAIRFILTLNSQLKRSQELLGHRFSQPSEGCCQGQFYHGYVTCLSDAIRYMVEVEGFSSSDALISNLRNSLHKRSQTLAPELTINPVDVPVNTSTCPTRSSCLNHGTTSSHDFDPQLNISLSNTFSCADTSHATKTERHLSLSGEITLQTADSFGSTVISETNSSSGQANYSPTVPHLDSPQEGKNNMIFIHPNLSNSAPVSMTTSTSTSTSVTPNHLQPSHTRCFKYKEDMKLRFNADSMKCGMERPCEEKCLSSNMSVNSLDPPHFESAPVSSPSFHQDESSQDSLLTHSQHHTKQQISGINAVENKSPSKEGNHSFQPSSLLPGFVLHAGGTYYIPLLIAPELIYPSFNTECDSFSKSTAGSLNILHPISIPVNLSGTHYALTRDIQADTQNHSKVVHPHLHGTHQRSRDVQMESFHGLMMPQVHTSCEATSSTLVSSKASTSLFSPNSVILHQSEPSPAYIFVPTPAMTNPSFCSQPSTLKSTSINAPSSLIHPKGATIILPAALGRVDGVSFDPFHASMTNSHGIPSSVVVPNGFVNMKPMKSVHLHESGNKE